jgi:hypothetical protein
MRARRRLPLLVVAAALFAGLGAEGEPAWAQAPSASATPETAMSVAELDRLIAGLGRESAEERRAAAVALGALGADATGAIAQKLAELRKGGDGGMGGTVRARRGASISWRRS